MNTTFGQAFRDMIGPIYPVIVYMLIPTAVTMSVLCLFTMMFIKNERATEAAKQWLGRILTGTAVLLLLGLFFTIMYGIIKGLFNTNLDVPMPRG